MTTIQRIGWIKFTSHCVHISKDSESDRIYCVKQGNDRWDFAQFDSEWEAADYILEPLARNLYHFQLDSE
jgi:hypothetical protein